MEGNDLYVNKSAAEACSISDTEKLRRSIQEVSGSFEIGEGCWFKCTGARGGEHLTPCTSRNASRKQSTDALKVTLSAFSSIKSEDLRVLVDVIICPGLASDVCLRPRPPPSVVVLGADDALPYII